MQEEEDEEEDKCKEKRWTKKKMLDEMQEEEEEEEEEDTCKLRKRVRRRHKYDKTKLSKLGRSVFEPTFQQMSELRRENT